MKTALLPRTDHNGVNLYIRPLADGYGARQFMPVPDVNEINVRRHLADARFIFFDGVGDVPDKCILPLLNGYNVFKIQIPDAATETGIVLVFAGAGRKKQFQIPVDGFILAAPQQVFRFKQAGKQ
jgi:hypothetical protein